MVVALFTVRNPLPLIWYQVKEMRLNIAGHGKSQTKPFFQGPILCH